MIKLTQKLPYEITVALSGGVDSVAATNFLSNKHFVTCAFFHHGTVECSNALKFVMNFCDTKQLPLIIGYITQDRPKGLSKEEFWRNERYEFLHSIDSVVVTAHTLDDCVETYLWGCIHGTPQVIPAKRGNCVRPFLTTKKAELKSWSSTWYEDSSNKDTSIMRNYIRQELMPHALKVNPGLHKVVKKIVEKRNVEYS